jgi:hypothetical protein
MEECVHRTQMPSLPAKINRGITLNWEKWYTQMPSLPAKINRGINLNWEKW